MRDVVMLQTSSECYSCTLAETGDMTVASPGTQLCSRCGKYPRTPYSPTANPDS